MEKPIQRGDKFKNSVGKICTIIEIERDNKVHYLHENSHTYHSSIVWIRKNWTKLHPAEESYLEVLEKDMTTKTSTKETKMQDICQYLTENFSKEVAVRFAKTAVSKYKENFLAMNDTTNRPDRIVNTPYWRNTPEGHDYWKSVHDRCSKTSHVKIYYSTLEKYANESLDSKPTKSIKEKGETTMSKVKTTVTSTLEQNKQAAIIAAQVDAGRIINKQVIKQLKPHIPMFFRGYLDTPLAPIIAANAVAMIGNHTGNEKIKKIGELMLLGAADVTVQSFNLDKIIDDVLKGISLPEGILDASSDK